MLSELMDLVVGAGGPVVADRLTSLDARESVACGEEVGEPSTFSLLLESMLTGGLSSSSRTARSNALTQAWSS